MAMWRPVLEGMSTWTEMQTLTPAEVFEFNAAIDLFIEEKNRQAEQK